MNQVVEFTSQSRGVKFKSTVTKTQSIRPVMVEQFRTFFNRLKVNVLCQKCYRQDLSKNEST